MKTEKKTQQRLKKVGKLLGIPILSEDKPLWVRIIKWKKGKDFCLIWIYIVFENRKKELAIWWKVISTDYKENFDQHTQRTTYKKDKIENIITMLEEGVKMAETSWDFEKFYDKSHFIPKANKTPEDLSKALEFTFNEANLGLTKKVVLKK